MGTHWPSQCCLYMGCRIPESVTMFLGNLLCLNSFSSGDIFGSPQESQEPGTPLLSLSLFKVRAPLQLQRDCAQWRCCKHRVDPSVELCGAGVSNRTLKQAGELFYYLIPLFQQKLH